MSNLVENVNKEILRQCREQIGLKLSEVEKKIKVSQDILNLYVRSGPVPVTIINNLKKMLEEDGAA